MEKNDKMYLEEFFKELNPGEIKKVSYKYKNKIIKGEIKVENNEKNERIFYFRPIEDIN